MSCTSQGQASSKVFEVYCMVRDRSGCSNETCRAIYLAQSFAYGAMHLLGLTLPVLYHGRIR